jgi:hypothetical protein
MKYVFAYRKSSWLPWKKIVVVGHRLEDGCMTLFKEDGGLETIPDWSKYALKLGSDWALAVKKNMENQSGVDVKVNI